MESLFSRSIERCSVHTLRLDCWKVFWRLHHFCPLSRDDRETLRCRSRGCHAIFHERDTKNRLAVDVCVWYFDRVFHRIHHLGHLSLESVAGYVGESLRPQSDQTRNCCLHRWADSHVRRSSGRWVTQRARAERFASAGGQWLHCFDLLFHWGHGGSPDPLWGR